MKFDENLYQTVDGWCNFQSLYKRQVDAHDNANFIEIGSWKGQSAILMASLIANNNKNIKFFCVDTWQGSDEHQNDSDVLNDSLFKTFLKNIEPVKDYISPVRKTSVDAAREFPNEFFDFIFIDAAHDYENVKNDINAWYPKLKKGGTFAGHDFHPTWSGVIQAVSEWSHQNKKYVSVEGTSWVHFKNSSS
jgi:predicted O-methyltransferase YrrM